MINFIKVEWRQATQRTIGFVLCFDDVEKKYKTYLGVGDGLSMNTDVKYIMDYGTKMCFNEAQAFFPELKREQYAWR